MANPLLRSYTINVPPTHEIVYDKVRELLLNGVLSPGDKLKEMEIAESFGVSRGPVREAFQQLVSEGILTAKKNRGVFVATMSEEDVKDIYFARLIIEREAFVHLQHSPDESVFSSLQQCIHNMDSLTNNENWNVVVKGDVEFHQSVVQALGSKRVNDFYSTIIAQITLCIAHLRGAYMAPSEIATEHKLLLELLRQGDKKPLLKELDRHMESAVEYLTGQH